MKRCFFFLFVIFLLHINVEGQNTYKTALVGFYNLENLYDTIFRLKNDDVAFTPGGVKAYTSTIFNDKINKLATVISQIGVDVNPDGLAILGVAEVENLSVLETLISHPHLAHRNYKIIHYDSRDFRGVDVAFIYNAKYFKVERSKPFYVMTPKGSKDAIFTRDILWVSGTLDGEKVEIFVNHWPSRYGGEKRSMPARMAAARAVRGVIDNLMSADPKVKIIVMGDLNDDPVNESITMGLRARGDIMKLQDGDLYNPWLTYYKSGMGTLAYQDAWSLFDQIIVSPSFIDKHQNGFFLYKNLIFNPSYLVENIGRYKGYPMRTYSGDVYRGGYSDHFPTYLILLKRVQDQ